MLIIRKSQLDAFAEQARERFVRKVVAYLRKTFAPARDMADGSLHDFVLAQVRKAEGYGLVTECDAALYVLAAWRFGADFDAPLCEPPHGIFSSAFTPNKRAQLLYRMVLGEDT
ncbi:hypothetical protein F0U61_53390 [Archangium violaceum]|uniref:hypothetical protein n=1 Tax=Archangium violaceum TaxID=83451 RepID=UPI002B2AB7FB|nr:hypothetical protein F0U61_53390 [Archangium violaceum]